VVVSSMALLLTVLVGASVSAGAATKATGTPLVIGTIETVTGSSQCSNCRVTAATDTLNAWVKQVNAAGGIGGHPLQLVALNDDADPGQAQTDLAKLQSDNALAVVGRTPLSPSPDGGATITKMAPGHWWHGLLDELDHQSGSSTQGSDAPLGGMGDHVRRVESSEATQTGLCSV